jgi:hypothetical protein
VSRYKDALAAVHRRNDVRQKGEGVPAFWLSNQKLCVDCRTMQPRKGGKDMGLAVGWVCVKCLKGV